MAEKETVSVDAKTQICEICADVKFEFITLPNCDHIMCKDCAKKYFTLQLEERSVLDMVCPLCKNPQITDKYLEDLKDLLKDLNLDKNTLTLSERRFHEFNLIDHPDFHRCENCESVFLLSRTLDKQKCNRCSYKICCRCSKQWNTEHENISCIEYNQILINNDPAYKSNDIEYYLKSYMTYSCPKCKIRFTLREGGCLHMTCFNCKYQYCLGCDNQFAKECNVENCIFDNGMHAHHPRNCYYYLRDNEINEIKDLLLIYNESFQIARTVKGGCKLKITDVNNVDKFECGNPIEVDNGDLCEEHYKRYLINIIKNKNLDNLCIMNVQQCMSTLKRHQIELPERGPWDTDDKYAEICREVIRQQIPI